MKKINFNNNKKVLQKSILKKINNKPIRKPVNKPIRKPVNKPIRKPVNKPIKKPVNKPIKKLANKPIRKPVNKPIKKLANKPIRKPVNKLIRKPINKPVNKPINKPVNKPIRKPVNKLIKKLVNKQIKNGNKFDMRNLTTNNTSKHRKTINKGINNLVSVIIPSYNCEKYIIGTIESVVNQTYKNWELIIIDDASPDNTHDIVSKYIEENNLNDKIKLIKNTKNKGCYVSFNIGIRQSKGEYICILGSDDKYHLNKLNIQTNILNKSKNLVATLGFFKRGTKTVKRKNMTSCTIMFRRQIINKIGYFDSVRYGADDEFMHRILTVYGVNKVKTVNEVLYNAVIRTGSLTRSKKTGFKTKNRQNYWRSVLEWHNRDRRNLYISYPLKRRPFPVHKSMING